MLKRVQAVALLLGCWDGGKQALVQRIMLVGITLQVTGAGVLLPI